MQRWRWIVLDECYFILTSEFNMLTDVSLFKVDGRQTESCLYNDTSTTAEDK